MAKIIEEEIKKLTNIELSKQELINDLLDKQANKIIEKENVDLLIKLINNADNLSEANAIAMLGTTYKQTGFHFDKRLEKWGDTIKYFKKNEKLSFVQDESKPMNKLIIGDNYDTLLNLLITHRGIIDVIYIDPPYGCNNMGEFANTNYDNAITRDNLLSMLYPRLLLAKQLLSDEGVIFVSIDDLNVSYVKCLMDEIYGENMFVGQAPRKTCEIIRQNSQSVLQNIYDYVLIYRKNNTIFKQRITGSLEFPYNDGIDDYYLSDFQNSGENGTRKSRPNLYYSIWQNEDNTLTLEKKNENSKEILPKKVKGEDGRWLWKPETFIKDNHLLTVSGNTIKVKRYKNTVLKENSDINKYQSEKLWLDKFPNAEGTKVLKSILSNSNLFSYPKPVDLIKFLINLHPNKDAIVLDFFAGSGTTGQAVLDLNNEDEGNRQFILCTNNEITNKNPNGIAMDVTSKRLKRTMTGECYDGTKDFDWIKKNEPYGGNLEVLEINEVNSKEQEKGKNAFDVIDETLYGLPKFTSIEDKINWICSNFDKTQKYIEGE